MTDITVRHVVFSHRVADVVVKLDDGTTHRCGFHPGYVSGWECVTCGTGMCPAIEHAKAIVIDLEDQ